jgi:hypothetical protein
MCHLVSVLGLTLGLTLGFGGSYVLVLVFLFS